MTGTRLVRWAGSPLAGGEGVRRFHTELKRRVEGKCSLHSRIAAVHAVRPSRVAEGSGDRQRSGGVSELLDDHGGTQERGLGHSNDVFVGVRQKGRTKEHSVKDAKDKQ